MARHNNHDDQSSSSSSPSSDKDDDDRNSPVEAKRQPPSKKPKTSSHDNNDDAQLLSAVPLGLNAINSIRADNGSKKEKTQQPVIILLDQASLETVKDKRGVYELLNCDDHRELCKKKLHKDPNQFRPDILHQELLALLDSPLNKAGLLRVYIHTTKKVLIEVHPSIRIPRTYKRFAGLMVQLLHKMKIKAGDASSTTLLKIIKNPFSSHLPPGTRCYGFECEGQLYSPVALAKVVVPLMPDTSGATPPTCLVMGAMSTGNVTIDDHPYIEKMFSVSSYPLSGAAAASRVVGGIEHHWGIV